MREGTGNRKVPEREDMASASEAVGSQYELPRNGHSVLAQVQVLEFGNTLFSEHIADFCPRRLRRWSEVGQVGCFTTQPLDGRLFVP